MILPMKIRKVLTVMLCVLIFAIVFVVVVPTSVSTADNISRIELTPVSPPTILNVYPNSAKQRQTLELTISGKDFIEGAEISFSETREEPSATPCNRKFKIIWDDCEEVKVRIFHADARGKWLQMEYKEYKKTPDEPPDPKRSSRCMHHIRTVVTEDNVTYILLHFDGYVWVERDRIVKDKTRGTGTINIDSLNFVSNTELRTVITIGTDVPAGIWNVTVIHPDGQSYTLKEGLTVTEAKPIIDELEHYVKTVYNPNVEKVPGFVRTLFGNERINARITRDDGSMLTIGLRTENAKVKEIQEGGISHPTMIAYTNESVIYSIMDSDDPIIAFQEALAKGKITYEGVGMMNKVRLGVVTVVVEVYSIVKWLFG